MGSKKILYWFRIFTNDDSASQNKARSFRTVVVADQFAQYKVLFYNYALHILANDKDSFRKCSSILCKVYIRGASRMDRIYVAATLRGSHCDSLKSSATSVRRRLSVRTHL